MSEKRFEIVKGTDYNVNKEAYFIQDTHYGVLKFGSFWKEKFAKEDCKRLNDICELIEELHTSDHMGWERAEKFEKELKQKKIYIKRLEYKVQKFKEENEQLKDKIDVLEDDNETYHKSLEKLNLYTKRFIPTKCAKEFKDCKTNRYYWLDHEGNFEGCLELLNLLDCENEVLKFDNRELKGRLMLYEEQIKGDLNGRL